jgi:acyl carrier protein
MKAPAIDAPAKARLFPEADIRRRMKEFWNEKTEEEAENPFAPKRDHTLFDVLPDIDSLEIVKFMLRIEEIIDLEIPPKFIQRGGYGSADEMIQHLMPQIQSLFRQGRK